MTTSFEKSGIFLTPETPKHSQMTDEFRQARSDDAGFYDDGIIQQIMLNKDVDADDYHIDVSVPLNSKTFQRGLVPRNSKVDIILKSLKDLANRTTETEILSTASPIEEPTTNVELSIDSTKEFQYSLKEDKGKGRDHLEIFVDLATNAFVSLNNIRGRLSYTQEFMTENIPTSEHISNYKSDQYPLSAINAWIWMSAEIVELFTSSTDVLQDPRDLEKCEDFIWEQLPIISDQIKTLRSSLSIFESDFSKFNTKFSKVHASIRRTFSEAISVDVEDFRNRFLQESLERSGEMISVLSRSSPLPQCVADEQSEFIGWGIDGLTLKTKKTSSFILLRVTKTNSVRFLSALKFFFEGFNNFLKRSSWFFKGISTAFSKIVEQNDGPTDILSNLLTISETMGYVFPMEQSRCIQVVWQIEQVLKESWEILDNVTEELDKSQQLWQKVFGKEIVRRNRFSLSLEHFHDWKLCRGLTFQLTLGNADLPRKSGKLSLMVPYKCSSNTPLFFQVFENCFCSVVDFEAEYKHRTERLRYTGKVLDDDVLVCSDVIQHVYYYVHIVIENLKRMSDSLLGIHKNIMETISTNSDRKAFLGLNCWFFICTECLLAIGSNCDETMKQNFISEFQNCFRLVNEWLGHVQTLERKYKRQLKEIRKIQNVFPKTYLGTSLCTEEEIESVNNNFQQETTDRSGNKEGGVRINIAYDGMFIEYSEYSRNVRIMDSHYFACTTKIFLNHTMEMMSSANNVCLEALELLNSSKTSERRVNGKKGIGNILGVRDTIQQIQDDLQHPPNLNPLEVLVGRLSLMDLHAAIFDFLTIQRDILAIKDYLNQDLEYPMRVLNGLMEKRWPSPKTKIGSVADYTSETLTITIDQKPLVNELKHILVILGGCTDETSKDRYKELLYPVHVTSRGSKMATLNEEFAENIFVRLNSLRSSFQRRSSISTNCQSQTNCHVRRTSSFMKPFFISILPALITIVLQHTHPDWNNAPWVKETQKIFKNLKKLSKETDSYLSTLQNLNTRLQEASSLLTTLCGKTLQRSVNDHSDAESELSSTSESDISESSGVHGDIFLRLEVMERDHSPGGLISVNFVGSEKWDKLYDLTTRAQVNVMRDMIDALMTTLARQSKNFQKFADKKVFNSLKKLLPTLTEKDSSNTHKLYLRFEAAKKVLNRVVYALNITRCSLDESLNLFGNFSTVENNTLEPILSKFRATLPTRVLVSSSKASD